MNCENMTATSRFTHDFQPNIVFTAPSPSRTTRMPLRRTETSINVFDAKGHSATQPSTSARRPLVRVGANETIASMSSSSTSTSISTPVPSGESVSFPTTRPVRPLRRQSTMIFQLPAGTAALAPLAPIPSTPTMRTIQPLRRQRAIDFEQLGLRLPTAAATLAPPDSVPSVPTTRTVQPLHRQRAIDFEQLDQVVASPAARSAARRLQRSSTIMNVTASTSSTITTPAPGASTSIRQPPKVEIKEPERHNQRGSIHVTYETYEWIQLPGRRRVKGIHIHAGSKIRIVGLPTHVILSRELLAGITAIKGEESPLAQFYRTEVDGIYVPSNAIIVQERIEKEEEAPKEKPKDVTLTVLPMFEVIVVGGGRVKGVTVIPQNFVLEETSAPMVANKRKLQMMQNDTPLVREKSDLEVVEDEEVKPAKKTRYAKSGINEEQIPKGSMMKDRRTKKTKKTEDGNVRPRKVANPPSSSRNSMQVD
ncbi:hypothetical protein BDQ17DRAFT_1365452 [Cyathus striatus]|nr:hypothetical protein BDQ17DRAFT_1365452 [Cyathus striatus]